MKCEHRLRSTEQHQPIRGHYCDAPGERHEVRVQGIVRRIVLCPEHATSYPSAEPIDRCDGCGETVRNVEGLTWCTDGCLFDGALP